MTSDGATWLNNDFIMDNTLDINWMLIRSKVTQWMQKRCEQVDSMNTSNIHGKWQGHLIWNPTWNLHENQNYAAINIILINSNKVLYQPQSF